MGWTRHLFSVSAVCFGVGGLLFMAGWYAHAGQTLPAVACAVMGGSLMGVVGVAIWFIGD